VSIAKVVTAVPGRTVGVGLGVAAAGRVAVAVALGLGTNVVDGREVAECDVGSDAFAAVAGDVAVDVAGDAWSTGSALAGTQPTTVRATSKDPAAAGQWRSGQRIMRRDRHFHSATRPR
jgi:hypothetical protein